MLHLALIGLISSPLSHKKSSSFDKRDSCLIPVTKTSRNISFSWRKDSFPCFCKVAMTATWLQRSCNHNNGTELFSMVFTTKPENLSISLVEWTGTENVQENLLGEVGEYLCENGLLGC